MRAGLAPRLPAMCEQPAAFAGTVVITWPEPSSRGGVLAGWQVCITDPVTGALITTVSEVDAHLHATASGLVWADLTMFAGRDGKPLLEGDPILEPGPDGGEILTGTFPFLVTGMRVAS